MTNFTRIVPLRQKAALRQEIEAIFRDTSGEEASRNLPDLAMVEQDMATLVRAARKGNVQQAADRVIALLSLDLNVLRKAALLSLMVRLMGKRRFDAVAAYVFEKRAAYATAPG